MIFFSFKKKTIHLTFKLKSFNKVLKTNFIHKESDLSNLFNAALMEGVLSKNERE